MRWAKLGCIAPENSRDASKAKRLNVVAKQRARLHALVHKQSVSRATGYGFDAERAGAGKEVEHARASYRVGIGMGEDIEQRLTQPVGGGPHRVRFRARKRPRAELAANHSHYRGLGCFGRGPPDRSRRCGFLLPRLW